MKIGIVDLDTSHPASWIPIERELGHEIIGVWDGGSVHPSGYAGKFASDHEIPRVYDSLDALAKDVDCAVLHGCNWDEHVSKARPFIESGKAVFIDKPLAGNPGDLACLVKWHEDGALITGGSALRYCAEIQAWKKKPISEAGELHTAFCGCGVDEFNYGIHAYSLLSGLFGAGIDRVRFLGQRGQQRIQVSWSDGRIGFVVVGEAAWMPFYATLATERASTHLVVNSANLYRAIIEQTFPYLAGEAPAPVAMSTLVESELSALAARQSCKCGGIEVKLSNLSPEARFDGEEFRLSYRTAKYPG